MIRVALLAVLATALVAAPAGAATVTYTPYVEPQGTDPESSCSRYMACPPDTLNVVDTRAERNDITLERVGFTQVVVRDAATPLEAGAGCTKEGDGSVRCPAAVSLYVDAGAGDDRVRAVGSVNGGDGDDDLAGTSVSGGPGRDVVRGDEGVNQLGGGPGADRVEAGGGDDIVTDDDGAQTAGDLLDGGAGVDTINFAEREASVVVDLAATPQAAGSAGEENAVAGFETVFGGNGDDELIGAPGTFPSRLQMAGGAGRDRIFMRATGTAASLDGGAGDDEITGSDGDESIVAGPGNDVIDAAGGDDTVTGGPGTDLANGGDGDDVLSGSGGRDDLVGNTGDDTADGGAGPDTLDGFEGDDRLDGGGGQDAVIGGDGDDRVSGGRSADGVEGGAGNDVLDGGGGRDRVRGGSGADRVSARDGKADDIDCGPSRDTVTADRRERARGCELVLRPKRRR